MSIYLVGGAVRDLLLGRRPGDLDFAFSGSLESFAASHAGARAVGVSVRVCLWRGREYMPLHENSSERDLAARDLTINALSSLIGEREAMAIRSKSLNYNYLTISSSSAVWLKVCMIGIIPVGFLLLGVDEVLRRRKKV